MRSAAVLAKVRDARGREPAFGRYPLMTKCRFSQVDRRSNRVLGMVRVYQPLPREVRGSRRNGGSSSVASSLATEIGEHDPMESRTSTWQGSEAFQGEMVLVCPRKEF